jgi:predicted ATPase
MTTVGIACSLLIAAGASYGLATLDRHPVTDKALYQQIARLERANLSLHFEREEIKRITERAVTLAQDTRGRCATWKP